MPKSPPRIMFYHDGRHPLIYMYEPPIEKEEYEAGVNELVGTPVEALMFCMGDGRTVLHETDVGELWGHNVEKWSHTIFRRAHPPRGCCSILPFWCSRGAGSGRMTAAARSSASTISIWR